VALGRVAARIAHEINNPLTAVKNSFLLIKPAISTEFRHYDYVNRIDKEINRMARIIRQMYDLYRPETPPAMEVDLAAVIGDIVALVEPNARARGVQITSDASQATDPLRINEDSLRQVLFNIVQNGIEASSADSSVEILVEPSDDRIVISVTDHGEGIPEELRSRIFEPFFTTKTGLTGGGLGLGLSITKGLIENLGGSLTFSTTPGLGTSFCVALPRNINVSQENH
jgi:two-component system, sporulation sensor kinase C